MRVADQRLSDLAVETRQADVKFAGQEEVAALAVEIDLGVDCNFRWELDVLFAGGEFERAHVTGRPSGPEKIFRGGVRLRELNIQKSVAAVSCAVMAIGGMHLTREKNLGSHMRSLSVCVAVLPRFGVVGH
jgi:hypothetical protein